MQSDWRCGSQRKRRTYTKVFSEEELFLSAHFSQQRIQTCLNHCWCFVIVIFLALCLSIKTFALVEAIGRVHSYCWLLPLLLRFVLTVMMMRKLLNRKQGLDGYRINKNFSISINSCSTRQMAHLKHCMTAYDAKTRFFRGSSTRLVGHK